VGALLQATRTMSIGVPGRRRSGRRRAQSTAWRGRAATTTGFMAFEYSIGGKWLELLNADSRRA